MLLVVSREPEEYGRDVVSSIVIEQHCRNSAAWIDTFN